MSGKGSEEYRIVILLLLLPYERKIFMKNSWQEKREIHLQVYVKYISMEFHVFIIYISYLNKSKRKR